MVRSLIHYGQFNNYLTEVQETTPRPLMFLTASTPETPFSIFSLSPILPLVLSDSVKRAVAVPGEATPMNPATFSEDAEDTDGAGNGWQQLIRRGGNIHATSKV
ncbi:hypothetical protein QYF36_019313 [Acer negundo]|nr:hypothetical protein QYF36_019313 [Acer negundo]